MTYKEWIENKGRCCHQLPKAHGPQICPICRDGACPVCKIEYESSKSGKK